MSVVDDIRIKQFRDNEKPVVVNITISAKNVEEMKQEGEMVKKALREYENMEAAFARDLGRSDVVYEEMAEPGAALHYNKYEYKENYPFVEIPLIIEGEIKNAAGEVLKHTGYRYDCDMVTFTDTTGAQYAIPGLLLRNSTKPYILVADPIVTFARPIHPWKLSDDQED